MPWDAVADKFAGWFSTLKFGDALNVMLILILTALLGSGIWWMGSTVLPEQTRTINDGFDRINKVNSDTIKSLADKHREERAVSTQESTERLKIITESFKDTLDRNEKQADKRDVLLEKFVRKIDKDMP